MSELKTLTKSQYQKATQKHIDVLKSQISYNMGIFNSKKKKLTGDNQARLKAKEQAKKLQKELEDFSAQRTTALNNYQGYIDSGEIAVKARNPDDIIVNQFPADLLNFKKKK